METQINLISLPRDKSTIKENELGQEAREWLQYFKNRKGFEEIMLTTELANKYLLVNKVNRKASEGHLEKLCHAIRSGQWEYRADPIRFDSDGWLRDGQHRCIAVIRTGINIRALVVYGVDPGNCNAIGSDIRTKTVGDYLVSMNYKDTNALAGAARLLYLYRNNKFPKDIHHYSGTTFYDILQIIKNNPDLQESVKYGLRLKKIMGISIAGFYHYILSEIDSQSTNLFFEKLSDGILLEKTNPIRLLRERLIKNKDSRTGKLRKIVVHALIIKTWNAFYTNEDIGQLRWPSPGEKFPVIVSG